MCKKILFLRNNLIDDNLIIKAVVKTFKVLFIMKITKILSLILCFTLVQISAQILNKKAEFTKEDTLRGTNNINRSWWKVQKYLIKIEPNFETKSIKGSNTIIFKRISNSENTMQIDLQEGMQIDSIYADNKRLEGLQRKGNYYLIGLFDSFLYNPGMNSVTVYFSGTPKIAKKAPWDGGWIFTKDINGKPWMTLAVEGLGASSWLPCKDFQAEEPEKGIEFTIVVPENLIAIANGKLESSGEDYTMVEKVYNSKIKTKKGIRNQTNRVMEPVKSGKKYYTWKTVSPINNYNIVPYIGDYVHFSDTYQGVKNKIDLDYWVKPENLEKAKIQFQQVKQMLKAFEYWFGPYPFYKDGYKLVEAPHLGMEHQSDIAYGNHYLNGYLGSDLSGTGVGLKFDFIIVHESGHEWFGNNITAKDPADMWIHEGFTCYSETLFTEYTFGKEDAQKYIIGLRKNVLNDIPIIGKYIVNQEGSGDMYYKAANMIHTIRQIIGNDDTFRQMLIGMNSDFKFKTVTTQEIEKYINDKSGINFSKVFDQYLRTTQIPVLEYTLNKKSFKYRWTNCVSGFDMKVNTSKGMISPTTEWQEILPENTKKKTLKQFKKDWENFSVDENYYVEVKKVK